MKIAIGQITVADNSAANAEQIAKLAEQAANAGARLFLVPEGVIARDPSNANASADAAEPIDGPFLTAMRAASAASNIAIAGTVHVPSDVPGKVTNLGFVIDGGDLIAQYRKIHPYDAFNGRESDRVAPGSEEPPVFRIDNVPFGLMTCYDVRFPEVARSLALRGAEVILLPAAWVRGPLKEMHWATMATARALENTVYVAGCGETSARNIGCSLVIDPLGVVVAATGSEPTLMFADVLPDRVASARRQLPVLENLRYAPPVLNPAR